MSSDIRDQLQAALGSAYTLGHELGGGGMSRVFVAREAALGRDVVIKVLPPEMAIGVSIDRFKREIQVAAQLQQANIVPLLAAGEANGLPYYVMPYVRGESLRARLARDGELPVADAIGILREVARALAAAHRHGVVHRDIKPDNVLLSGGSAVVTDFGVAKALTAASGTAAAEITDLGMALGTPAYMSPEQASADPHVDHRADIYAFGCLGYELLTGQTPFVGRSAAATLAAHVSEPPESIARRRATMPPSLASLLMRCLEKRPADRPQSADELLHALDALITPSGGTDPTGHIATVGRRGRRRAVLVVGALVVLGVIGGFVVMKRRGEAASESPIRSIAVLPFENTGGDTATAYFADGMRDEIATALGKVPGLSVLSRASSYAFRGKTNATPGDIRRELGVDAVLEGAVRRAGDQLRISAELTRVSTGLGLWSDSYNRKVTDVFAVQEELARAIAITLSSAVRSATTTPAVSVAKSRGTENQEAYDLYLRGRYLLNARRELSRAIALFDSAGRRDGLFAQAFAGAASADVLLPFYDGLPATDALRRARIAATRALAIDSTLAEPHAALGFGLAQTFAWDDAERELKRAIALDSTSATAFHLYGFMLAGLGRWADALPVYERAIRLDPLSPVISQSYAVVLIKSGKIEEAVVVGRRMSEMDPTSPLVARMQARIFAVKGDWVQAAQVLERFADDPVQRPDRVYVYAKLGRRREADSLRAVIEHHATDGGRYTDVAVAYAALGDTAHALQWFERAIDRFDGGLINAGLSDRPEFDFLRNDPRFIRLLARMGLGSKRPSR